MENARNDFQNQPNLENNAAVQQFDPRGLSLLHSPSLIISDLLVLSESQSSSSSSSYCPSENKQNAFFRFEQNPLQLSSSFRLSGSNEQLSQNGFGSCGTSTGSGSPPFEAISEPTSEQLALLSVEALQGPSGVQAPPIHNRNYQEARYKTELCLHHRESNNCPHGDRCLFAHGLQELRPYRGRHPKHKTQNCKAFHETGYCNYGYRCSYIHLESNETIQYIRQLNEVAQYRRRSQLERSFTFKKSPKRHQSNH